MEPPDFLLRKLYRKGSLAETAGHRFRFTLFNKLGPATLIGPPRIIVNGILHDASQVRTPGVDLAAISPSRPFRFAKGAQATLSMPGALLRGGNRIQVFVPTQEWGLLTIEAEDSCAEFCDLADPHEKSSGPN